MELSVFELDKGQTLRVKSPGKCIYCGSNQGKLRDEHVIPYALAANTIILEKSCCETCQNIVQRYEQEVLKKQLGVFRAQVDAPTRRPKDRPTHVDLHFVEVNADGQLIRDLGFRSIPINEAPIAFHLWASPMPRRLRDPADPAVDSGCPWSFLDKEAAYILCRKVAKDTGANHVAVNTGQVSRLHYLRSLAKTAHAFAAAKFGVDAFEPFLTDLILNRSHDVAEYVGDDPFTAPTEDIDGHTLQIFLGEAIGGPERRLLVARFQLYPFLNSPAHLVVVGKALVDIGARLRGEV
ncbi:MAG: hypothetical protein E5X49_32920 [Mesorhizobium sp.]|uniref:hypothetical protein n=1 Tax=Mesorhizobium sp. TaxID=1871066 RepID=UPI000FE5724E|nr:hypothetical protein [Mesorhizobium sp.]RWA60684.1 MAG: hypothetical protein EOQ28_32320 [Mesorhizobium sp.]RWB96745.1 MAG: hypothetical protein EOQ57_25885 [Mesorhizobium sp.]TIQ36341.1 MAG: hypothetical protein E5X49_32920 [Mesorhizobium sp.]